MRVKGVQSPRKEFACGSKESDRPLSRFPLRGQAGAGGFTPRRLARCGASKKRWHASCAGSPHKRAAAPLCIPCERCGAGLDTAPENRLHKILDTTWRFGTQRLSVVQIVSLL